MANPLLPQPRLMFHRGPGTLSFPSSRDSGPDTLWEAPTSPWEKVGGSLPPQPVTGSVPICAQSSELCLPWDISMEHRERNQGQSDFFSGVGGKLHSARDTLEGTYQRGPTQVWEPSETLCFLRFTSHHLSLSSAMAMWPISFCQLLFPLPQGPCTVCPLCQEYYFSTLFTLPLLIWDS